MSRVTVRDVIEAAAQTWGWTADDIRSDRRHSDLPTVRQAAYWIARDVTRQTYPQIARSFARDHSTVLHGCRATFARIVFDDAFAALVRQAAAGARLRAAMRSDAASRQDADRAPA